MLFAPVAQAVSEDEFDLMQRLPVTQKVTAQEARSRIRNWHDFIENTRHKPDSDKLRAVNEYFNALRFIEDRDLWARKDYWATPLQMLAVGAGDCEDFAIAKYFTLKALGISNEQLRITYVWNNESKKGSRQPHMVLNYLATPNAEPLVLDNLIDDILPLTYRSGLEPVYGINSDGLWLVGDNVQGIPAGSPAQLSQWRLLSQAMDSDAILLQVK